MRARTSKRRSGRLKESEFLLELQSYPDYELTFKHALTYDVAYDSLLSTQRKSLHKKTAEAIEALFGERRNEYVEMLAHHALRAEDWEAAAQYSNEAGLRALENSGYVKAELFFETAMDTLAKLPATRPRIQLGIDIRTRLRPVYSATNKGDLGFERLKEAQDLAEEIGDNPRLFEVLLHDSFLCSTLARADPRH